MGRGVFRNYYKGHMDKNKGEGGCGGTRGGENGGRKMETTVIKQQLKK